MIVLVANALLFGVIAREGYAGTLGGLSWALDGAAAPVVAIERLEVEMAVAGALKGSRDGRRATSSTTEPSRRGTYAELDSIQAEFYA